MPRTSPTGRTEQLLSRYAGKVETSLSDWLDRSGAPAELLEAMRYAVLGGGKRLRPAIVHLAARAAAGGGEPPIDPMPAAVAVELVHCYSLVHDDLPAMDNDTLRRGRPTVHVRFGEAMAILVGDALLTHAFAVLCEGVADPAAGSALMRELTRAAGPGGMIAGQAADMGLCEVPAGLAGLEYIHARKTGAMFSAAARMGAICGSAGEAAREALGEFGTELGKAFQIKDDLLDATATSQELGKTPGKDAAAGKKTYVGEIGLDASVAAVEQASRAAMKHLAGFGSSADPLRELVNLLLQREY